jgi:cbb3-type cytochrome oxidase subunit 3
MAAWVFWWLLILTIVFIVLILVALNNSRQGKKELKEAKAALVEGLRDFKLTDEERQRIWKEVKEIPFADALKEFIKKVVRQAKGT